MAANHMSGGPGGRAADRDRTLAGSVSTLWNQGLIQDFRIQIDGREFQVNKAVFASLSRRFCSILMETGADNNNCIVINGVDADAMEILVPFIHTNKMKVTKKDVMEVLAAAVYFQIESAIRICTKFMVDDLNVCNWYKVLKVFRSFKLLEATEQVLNYVKKDIRGIIQIFDSCRLRYEDFSFFVKNWQGSETELFQFIIDWVNADLENRRQYQGDLLCSVRYCLMTPKELTAIRERKISKPNPWRPLITKAFKYHKLPMHLKVGDTSEQTQIRSPPSFVIFSTEEPESEGSFYEPLEEKRFIQHEGLRLSFRCRRYHEVLVVNNFLIVASNKRCMMFDPRTLQWLQMPKVPDMEVVWGGDVDCSGEDQSKIGLLAHNDKFLYVVGGAEYDGYPIVQITRYNFRRNEWKYFSKMPAWLKDFAVCILNNGLYILGGVEDADHTANHGESARVHHLDLATRKWIVKARMFKQKNSISVHVMKVFGEESICTFDEACNMEYYTPSKDQWSRCTFSFNLQPLCRAPVIWGRNNNEWSCGNMLFISDVKGGIVDGQQQSVCAVISIPEEGTDAVVDYIHEYAGERLATFCTILSIAPQASMTRVKRVLEV